MVCCSGSGDAVSQRAWLALNQRPGLRSNAPSCFTRAAPSLIKVAKKGILAVSSRFKDQHIEFRNGAIGQPLSFESSNPANYTDLISGGAAKSTLQIDGQLFLPPEPMDTPTPLVIVVPGSVGVAVSHLSHAETLTDLGIAAFVIDPFGARSVSSTVANQTQFSFAASAYDVLAAIQFIASLSEIDSDRIGAQGHSRGGTAVLSAAMQTLSAAIPNASAELRAVYSVYPWCGHQFLNPDIGNVRVRVVIGERDNWCSPQQAQGYAQAIRLAGGDVSFRLFAEAEHSFDRHPPIETTPDAEVAPHAPTIYISATGAMIHPVTGLEDANATDREMMVYGLKAGFGVTGASLGGQGDQPVRFKEDMSTFWLETFER